MGPYVVISLPIISSFVFPTESAKADLLQEITLCPYTMLEKACFQLSNSSEYYYENSRHLNPLNSNQFRCIINPIILYFHFMIEDNKNNKFYKNLKPRSFDRGFILIYILLTNHLSSHYFTYANIFVFASWIYV